MSALRYNKVAVIMGGLSAEREISILSGTGVLEALSSRGVEAHRFDPATDDLMRLKREGFEAAFIALHGRFGEDGAMQGALEVMGIPYTGSGVLASAIAMDKVFTKRIWESHQLPTPRYALLSRATRFVEVPDQLGLPLIIKPPHEGSTLGVTKVMGYSDVASAFDFAAQFDDIVLAEEFIDGRELTVAILGTGDQARALPIVDIVAPEGNYDYENKYFTDVTQYICPAVLDTETSRSVQELALRAFHAVGCEGWARVDVMLRKSDAKPFLLEVNTSPGMTGHSLVPIAARAMGLSYPDLCVEILQGAALKIKRLTTMPVRKDTDQRLGEGL